MAAEVAKLVHPKVLIEAPEWAGSKADDYFGLAAKLRKDAGL
jgi:hypothetical protein